MKEPKIIEVVWEDAASSEGWKHPSVVKQMNDDGYPCKTVGFFFSRDKNGICVTSTLGPPEGEDTPRAGVWRIPAGMIKKVRTLR